MVASRAERKSERPMALIASHLRLSYIDSLPCLFSGKSGDYRGNVFHLPLEDMEVGEAIAFMLLLQMCDSLLRGHLLSLEGRPRLGNGFAPAIGDHDAVDCLA